MEQDFADAATAGKLTVKVDGADDTITKINATLDALNAPCKDFQGNWTCGPIQQLSQTEKNIGILAAKSAQQVQQSATLVNSTSSAITSAANDVHVMAARGTETLSAATVTIKTAGTTLEGFQPLIADADDSVRQFNALLASKDLANGLHGGAETAVHFAALTGDLSIWAHPMLNPDPCTTRKCTAGRVFTKLGGYLGLASDASTAARFFSPLPVKLK